MRPPKAILTTVGAVVLALALTCSSGGAPATAASSITVKSLVIQAHRGGPALGAPENTVKLFRLAVASGVVDRIETDVRMTADKVLVMTHDSVLPARCTSAGVQVSTMTWAELSAVRCDGEPIPTLAQALAVVKGTKVDLAVELKHDDDWSAAFETAYVKGVVSTILSSGLAKGQVRIISYYWRSYAGIVKKYGKGLPMTAMEFATRTEPTDNIYAQVRKAKGLGVSSYTISANYAQSALLAFVRDYGGMSVGVQNADTTAKLRFALANGLRTVTSDDPVAARAYADTLLADLAAKPLTLSRKTTSLTATTVLKKKALKKKGKVFPKVIGGSAVVPAAAAQQLDGIRFSVTVSSKGKGKLELAPSGSRVGKDGARVKFTKGTRSFTVYASPGDGGKIRVYTTAAATVTVTITGYRTANY